MAYVYVPHKPVHSSSHNRRWPFVGIRPQVHLIERHALAVQKDLAPYPAAVANQAVELDGVLPLGRTAPFEVTPLGVGVKRTADAGRARRLRKLRVKAMIEMAAVSLGHNPRVGRPWTPKEGEMMAEVGYRPGSTHSVLAE